ncbi:MAG: NfeD family protein, partial [Candidatus Omnitrophica bacterium]|nr:NfeD family protein [Candidatus Omnitrophota bacterium]
PGFGFAGVLALITLAFACYQAFTTLSPIAGVIVTFSSIIITIIAVKILPRTPVWQKIRLSKTEEKSKGYHAGRGGYEHLLNHSGKSLTMLRPSGTALIENQRYDVVTDGEFIEKDSAIIVHQIDGNRIIVRKMSSDHGPQSTENT